MSNLAQRLITGTIFVIVLVGCIWWSYWSLLILFIAITGLGLHEFYKLSRKTGAVPATTYSIVVGIFIIVCSFLAKLQPSDKILLPIIPLVFLIFFVELYRKKDNPFANIAWSIAGLIYISVPLAMLLHTFTPTQYVEYTRIDPDRIQHYNPLPILSFFILIWVSDSMAYVCGRIFGKHKLWERISPKKTWEGFIGGLLFCAATGWLIGHHWFPVGHWCKSEINWTLIAIVISATGMLGDLVESLFKRSIDVKDSGTILPGHGGILDRFDALFLATPFALTAYWLFQ